MAYPFIDALTGRWISAQGQLIPADSPEAQDYYAPTERKMYYEVIRLVQGVPLFWEDHMIRLTHSVGGEMTIPSSLYTESMALIRENCLKEANLRLVLTKETRIIHLTPSYYPDETLIREGVPTGILVWERTDPNTKIIRSDYKSAVAERFAQPGPFGSCFELLLADHQGYLTEGSRSNLFFIRGSKVLTPPDDRVLKGITRQYIVQAIAEAGLTLQIGMLTLKDLQKDPAITAFISASPIDLLPVRAIDNLVMTSAQDQSFQNIRAAYMKIVNTYIQDRRLSKNGHPVDSAGYGR
ncbi:MAG: aminotransferase class IV [Clostridiaceae bacterium]|nr:aminotransferase class IV [Clostridiaceae bacterium]